MSGIAHIVYDEFNKRGKVKKNPGVTVRRFRTELKKQGLNWKETHYLQGTFSLEYLYSATDRTIVKFEW